MNNGMKHMQKMDEVVIPAGEQLRFEPGGKHLMLSQPSKPVTSGQIIELTLVFSSGQSQTIVFSVRKNE